METTATKLTPETFADLQNSWLKAYLKRHGFSRHQFDTYNHFVLQGIQETVCASANRDGFFDVAATASTPRRTMRLTFQRVTIFPPSLKNENGIFEKTTPSQCRLKKCSYQVGVAVDIKQEVTTYDDCGGASSSSKSLKGRTKTTCFREVPIFKFPCMVRSAVCNIRDEPPTDDDDALGGYYVISGMEKTTQAQIKLQLNWPFCHRVSSTSRYSEVRSCDESKWMATSSLRVLLKPNKSIVVTSPAFAEDMPFFVLVKLLTFDMTEDAVFHLIRLWHGRRVWHGGHKTCSDEETGVMLGSCAAATRDDLYDAAAAMYTRERTPERRVAALKRILRNEVLPHLETFDGKVYFLTLMASQVIYTDASEHDRDSWKSKRVDASGALCAMLVRQLWRNFIRSAFNGIRRAFETQPDYLNILSHLSSRKVETSIKFHFGTGMWSVMRGVAPSACSGVCQPLPRISRVAAISAMDRFNTPVNRNGKTSLPRMVHPSDMGNVCVTETPEGQGCGLVLNKTILATVRNATSTPLLFAMLDVIFADVPLQPYATWAQGDEELIMVVVNGVLWKCARHGVHTRELLRRARSTRQLPLETSIVWYAHMRIITLTCDSGAVLRPCIRLDRLRDAAAALPPRGRSPTINTWDAVERAGVEWLDTSEIEMHCVILNDAADLDRIQEFTHVEVHTAASMLGLTAAMTPFSNQDQSPRCIYQAAMGKQAMCTQQPGARKRLDQHTYYLWQGQRPLCATSVYNMVDDVPSTTEAVLMVSMYAGITQEDALIIKKSALDRGMFYASTTRTYLDELNARGNDDEIFCNPPPSATAYKRADYSKIQPDGFPKIGTKLNEGDVVIGKTSQNMQLGPDGRHLPLRFCRSTLAKEAGVVERIFFCQNREGRKQVKVLVRTERPVITGDKFASRHAQKGTVGMIVDEIDLPFSEATGMTPDVIISPLAFVSRMTIGMLSETLCGKAAALDGNFVDASPFQLKNPVDRAKVVLEQFGFRATGEEWFIDGRTGERIRSQIFMGLCAYQRLRHLVEEKVHSRTFGTKHALTMQPTEGRGKGGGLRMGEMERDTLISHGSANIILDRFLDQSDRCIVAVCEKCGLMAEQAHSKRFAYGLKRGRTSYCRNCEDSAHCREIAIPTAMRLLMSELLCFGAAIKIAGTAPALEAPDVDMHF